MSSSDYAVSEAGHADPELHVELQTSTDMQGRSIPEVRILGNRAGMRWLADHCSRLALASPTALEAGLHFHVEDYRFEPRWKSTERGPGPHWSAFVTVQLSGDDAIQRARVQSGLCAWCAQDLPDARQSVCPRCGREQMRKQPGGQ